MKKPLRKYVLGTDRWTNRAISPLDFASKSDMAKPKILVHPGWGKRPEMLSKLLFALADAGVMPIGVDTRFGYSDRQQEMGYHLGSTVDKLLRQSHRADSANPFFEVQSVWDNRYRLRRPTGLAALCVVLQIETASLFGHSEGGRIVTTLAAESDVLEVPKLVIANAVGTGSNSGAKGMAVSNFKDNELFHGAIDMKQAVWSAAGSTGHFITHPRRSTREKHVIDQAPLTMWRMLETVALQKQVDTTVLHARNDQLISFAECEAEANARPYIEFIPTEGGHSNVYTDAVTEQIVLSFVS